MNKESDQVIAEIGTDNDLCPDNEECQKANPTIFINQLFKNMGV